MIEAPDSQEHLCERFANGSIELIVSHSSKSFTMYYHPDNWHKLPIEKKVHFRNAMIRITDYWWSRGYQETTQKDS